MFRYIINIGYFCRNLYRIFLVNIIITGILEIFLFISDILETAKYFLILRIYSINYLKKYVINTELKKNNTSLKKYNEYCIIRNLLLISIF